MHHADGEAVFTASLMHPQDEDPELRLSRLRDLEPCQIEPPGISDIQRCELFNKLRPFLRPENRDITCPHPGQEILDRINKRKNEKKGVYKKRKKALAKISEKNRGSSYNKSCGCLY